jgi:hypothetical protein
LASHQYQVRDRLAKHTRLVAAYAGCHPLYSRGTNVFQRASTRPGSPQQGDRRARPQRDSHLSGVASTSTPRGLVANAHAIEGTGEDFRTRGSAGSYVPRGCCASEAHDPEGDCGASDARRRPQEGRPGPRRSTRKESEVGGGACIRTRFSRDACGVEPLAPGSCCSSCHSSSCGA